MTDDPCDKHDVEKFDGEIDPLYWLEAQFGLHRLPAHAWQAINLMRLRGNDCEHTFVVPTWIMSYIFEAAAIIDEMQKGALAGKKITGTATRVGSALGFDTRPGGLNGFERAALIERDEAMYWDVVEIVHPKVKARGDMERTAQADKLDNAYNIVAAHWRVSRSTVVKACLRVLKRARETAVFLGGREEKMNEIFPQAMSEHVRMSAEMRNEARKRFRANRREHDGSEEQLS